MGEAVKCLLPKRKVLVLDPSTHIKHWAGLIRQVSPGQLHVSQTGKIVNVSAIPMLGRQRTPGACWPARLADG